MAWSPFVHISQNISCRLFLVKSYMTQLRFQLTRCKFRVNLFSSAELFDISTKVTEAKSGLHGRYEFECRRGQLCEMMLLSEHENKNVNRREVILLNL